MPGELILILTICFAQEEITLLFRMNLGLKSSEYIVYGKKFLALNHSGTPEFV